MYEELKNRVNAQREILNIVNSKNWPCEPLFSLTRMAMKRWANYNQISSSYTLRWALSHYLAITHRSFKNVVITLNLLPTTL